MSRIPAGDDVLDPDEPTYDLPGVAELLGIPVTKVQQHLREGHLVAVRRAGDVLVPRVFFTDSGEVVKSLAGLLMVLHDGGYHETEIVRWLFTHDPSLTVTRDGKCYTSRPGSAWTGGNGERTKGRRAFFPLRRRAS